MPSRILIVEDEPKWYNAFQGILKGMGYAVDIAKDTHEATVLLESSRYDLMLLDVCLDGNDITLECQLFWNYLQQNYPALPIVAATGQPLEPSQMWTVFSQAQPVDFIYKHNIDLEDFRRRIRSILQNPPPPRPFKYDVFISYSHQDSDWVRNTLLPRLESEGLRVCIDYRDFEIGAPNLVNIENAVEHSRKTLLVLTPDWIASQWAEFEALLILTKDPAGRGRRILPLMVQSCQLPDRLQVFTYLDLTNPGEFDFQMRRLVAAIRSNPLPPTPAKPASAKKPVPSSGPPSRGFSHEHGLATLGELLAQADVETRLAFAVLESRLRDNLNAERLYGSNESIRADRARIVHELNRLALTHLGRSFNELCGN